MPQSGPGEEVGRKLSVKIYGWDKPSIQQATLNNRTSDVWLMRVIGTVTDTRAYKSRAAGSDGQALEGYGLVGDFELIGSPQSPKDPGLVRNGNLIYLPGFITDMLVGALGNEGDINLKIGLDVYARYDQDSATSYVFTARSLLPRDTSKLDEIRDQIKGMALPQVEGPKK